MGLTDFLFGVLTSITANRLDEPLRRILRVVDESDLGPDVASAPVATAPASVEPCVAAASRFRTFDIWHDLDAVISVIQDPRVYILIEDVPSTAYCLPAVVLQSIATGDWYVFHRGRLAFQGAGGGLANSRSIVEDLKRRGVPISAWIVRRTDLDAMEAGQVTWPAVSKDIVPLLAAPGTDFMWSEIAQNVSQMVTLSR